MRPCWPNQTDSLQEISSSSFTCKTLVHNSHVGLSTFWDVKSNITVRKPMQDIARASFLTHLLGQDIVCRSWTRSDTHWLNGWQDNMTVDSRYDLMLLVAVTCDLCCIVAALVVQPCKRMVHTPCQTYYSRTSWVHSEFLIKGPNAPQSQQKKKHSSCEWIQATPLHTKISW